MLLIISFAIIFIMNTNNNCNKKDDYSVDDLTAAIGKLGGSGKRDTDDIVISDDDLFKQPPPKEDCPIYLLCLPTLGSGSYYCHVVANKKLFAVAVIMHQ